jgi:hypothetical protein
LLSSFGAKGTLKVGKLDDGDKCVFVPDHGCRVIDIDLPPGDGSGSAARLGLIGIGVGRGLGGRVLICCTERARPCAPAWRRRWCRIVGLAGRPQKQKKTRKHR